MTRVKRGITSKRKHRKLQSLTKGFRGTKNRLVRVAKEAALHADSYSFHGRKLKKRNFRSLWITRINGALKDSGLSYSQFIFQLKSKKIALDRKILSDLVVNDINVFNQIVQSLKSSAPKSEPS